MTRPLVLSRNEPNITNHGVPTLPDTSFASGIFPSFGRFCEDEGFVDLDASTLSSSLSDSKSFCLDFLGEEVEAEGFEVDGPESVSSMSESTSS